MFENTKKLDQPAKLLVIDQTFTAPNQQVPASLIEFKDRQAGYFGSRYHFIIQRDGLVEFGRPQDKQSPLSRVANAEALCVVLVGGKSPDGNPSRNFTEAQENALEGLVDLLRMKAPDLKVCLLEDLVSRKNRHMLFNVDRYNP